MPKLFEKGNPGKPKGAVNKVSQRVRECVIMFLENNIDTIQKNFETLKSKEQLEFIEKILPYAIPKLHHIHNEQEGEIVHEIRVSWDMPKTLKDALQGSTHESSLGNQNGH
jgi:hypothetical protein